MLSSFLHDEGWHKSKELKEVSQIWRNIIHSSAAAKLPGAVERRWDENDKKGEVQDDETVTSDLSKSHKVTFAN